MVATVVMVLLNFVSWAALDAYETRQTYNLGWKIVAELISIFRFPTLIFFWKYIISNNSIILFTVGIFLNCAFYAILVERIYSFLRTKPISISNPNK
jgi:hypothetical protein